VTYFVHYVTVVHVHYVTVVGSVGFAGGWGVQPPPGYYPTLPLKLKKHRWGDRYLTPPPPPPHIYCCTQVSANDCH